MTVETSQKKLCRKCDQVKDLEGGFYRARQSYQKYCIPCHNAKRYDYAQTYKYEKRPKGFEKLSEDLREKILYDISIRINYKEIAEKYGLKYTTLLSWKRKGLLV